MFWKQHTFVICAYGKSEYLESCILSLKAQKVRSQILMVTSTPNALIKDLAEKYRVPLAINEGPSGIAEDWNFGYGRAGTDYVTIAHQDDLYHEEYTVWLKKWTEKAVVPLLFFTDYAEIRECKTIYINRLLRIKRLMLLPLRVPAFWKSRFVRRRILSFGSPICCPSVTFAKKNLPDRVFKPGFRSNEDWEAWESLSRKRGSFLYCSKVLTYHRIHEGSATTAIIEDTGRSREDYQMFCKFWPKPAARILTKLYGGSEKSNKMKETGS